MKSTHQKLLNATLKILRALARILVRHGVSHSEFSELARKAFVESAFEDFPIESKKQTVSRVAVLTGLSRKEVLRVKEEREIPVNKEPRPVNRAIRVINGWLNDSNYATPDGKARALPLYGDTGSFAALVKGYSGDITAGAIADELVRIGAAQMRGDTIELCAAGYVPAADTDEKIEIMGASTRDLLETLDHNLTSQEPNDRRLQRSVVYHQLPDHVAAEFKTLSEQKAAELLKELNHWLWSRKQQITRYELGTKRIGVGIYYFESDEDKLKTNQGTVS